jgi:hypothetical protein
MTVIPALRRLRQEGHGFKTSLGYTVRSLLSSLSLKKRRNDEHLRK